MKDEDGQSRIPASYVAVSAGYLVTGLFILLWPNMSLNAFYTVISVVLLVAGITYILMFFVKDRDNVLGNDLVSGVIYASFGAFMLLHPDFVETAFPFFVGVLLMIGSLYVLQNTIEMRRFGAPHFKPFLIFVVILFAAGAMLVYKPFGGKTLQCYIGASLAYAGVLGIISILYLNKYLKTPGPGPHKKNAKDPQGAIAEGPKAEALMPPADEDDK